MYDYMKALLQRFDTHSEQAAALEKSIEHEKINLYRITVPEKAKLIYYTNIMYYDNYNRTLPDGMNISDKVLFDMNKHTDYYKAIIYYISGMTDNYAIERYNSIIKF